MIKYKCDVKLNISYVKMCIFISVKIQALFHIFTRNSFASQQD